MPSFGALFSHKNLSRPLIHHKAASALLKRRPLPLLTGLKKETRIQQAPGGENLIKSSEKENLCKISPNALFHQNPLQKTRAPKTTQISHDPKLTTKLRLIWSHGKLSSDRLEETQNQVWIELELGKKKYRCKNSSRRWIGRKWFRTLYCWTGRRKIKTQPSENLRNITTECLSFGK